MSARGRHFAVAGSLVALAVISAGTGRGKSGETIAPSSADRRVTAENAAEPEKADPGAEPAAPGTAEKIALTMNRFGVLGYRPLHEEHQRTHPGMGPLEARPEQFAHLLDFGAGDLEETCSALEWQASLSAGGKWQIGPGTDVGGLAMC
jgi:cellobiose transport system substrate-binding protein